MEKGEASSTTSSPSAQAAAAAAAASNLTIKTGGDQPEKRSQVSPVSSTHPEIGTRDVLSEKPELSIQEIEENGGTGVSSTTKEILKDLNKQSKLLENGFNVVKKENNVISAKVRRFNTKPKDLLLVRILSAE